jgi:hypothetical protein
MKKYCYSGRNKPTYHRVGASKFFLSRINKWTFSRCLTFLFKTASNDLSPIAVAKGVEQLEVTPYHGRGQVIVTLMRGHGLCLVNFSFQSMNINTRSPDITMATGDVFQKTILSYAHSSGISFRNWKSNKILWQESFAILSRIMKGSKSFTYLMVFGTPQYFYSFFFLSKYIMC